MKRFVRRVIPYTVGLALLSVSAVNAQNCLDMGGVNPLNRSQNFDALGASPAPQIGDTTNIFVLSSVGPRRVLGKFDNAVANNAAVVNIPGWAIVEEGTNTSSVSGRYNAGNGSEPGGNTFSFGSDTLPADRALGSLNDDTIATNWLGGCFRNTSGVTVHNVRIRFTGELWRLGGSGLPDRLNFQYAVNATNLYTGTYSDFDPLDLGTPNLIGAAGQRDGNAPANRTFVPAQILTVTLAPNDTLFVRWMDSNIAGADDGLAIDDFEIILGAPLAADVQVTGRVISASGQGIASARLTIIGANGVNRTVQTNPFGYFVFDTVPAGEGYVLTVDSKRFRFSQPSQFINLNDAMTGITFVAQP